MIPLNQKLIELQQNIKKEFELILSEDQLVSQNEDSEPFSEDSQNENTIVFDPSFGLDIISFVHEYLLFIKALIQNKQIQNSAQLGEQLQWLANWRANFAYGKSLSFNYLHDWEMYEFLQSIKMNCSLQDIEEYLDELLEELDYIKKEVEETSTLEFQLD